MEEIEKNIVNSRGNGKLRSVYNTCLYSRLTKISKISILILCAPCKGFGDVIFATKIKRYIQQWYGIVPTIATTTPELFSKLGEPNTILLKGGGRTQCRRFAGLKSERSISRFDLILVAPLMADNSISFPDIKKLIPHSNRSNTFFFSEYNDYLDKGFDVNTGVGEGRDGMLFTTTTSNKKDIDKLGLGKYALGYIAESIDDSDKCFINFLDMIVLKYRDIESIVCPSWVTELPDKLFKRIKGVNIYAKLGADEYVIQESKSARRDIVLRCDVLPVANNVMISLIHYSVKDVLLTGDQSITDALSCCSSKNVFYQIAPWKEDLGRNLAKYLPNKFLKSKKTSCGCSGALKYTSNYKTFVKDWDFRTLGKPKIDAMISSVSIIKTNKHIRDRMNA